MRISLLLSSSLLVGCAPFAVKPDAHRPMAHVAVGDRQGEEFGAGYHGIVHIDNHNIPKGPVRSIYVVPGRRTIGYRCPGTIVMDGPPTLSGTFEGGTAYVLDCAGEPYLREARDGT